jgi:hypothetical protein
MDGTVVSTLSQSASESYWLFPIPVNAVVIGGEVRGSQPSSGVSGQALIKLGILAGSTVTDNLFGTYTVSGGAALNTALNPGKYTVSCSDDLSPYQIPIVATVNSGATATTSLSLYVRLDYVLNGQL